MYVEQNFQVVTYNTVCTGHIYHDNHDVNIVEEMMTKQKYQKPTKPGN